MQCSLLQLSEPVLVAAVVELEQDVGLGVLTSDNRRLAIAELEELYSVAVEVIDSNGQGLQGQVKIYLIAVLSVSIKDKVDYQIIDDFSFFFWNLVFIFLDKLIWIVL